MTYISSTENRRVSYIYKLALEKQTKFPRDLEEAKERTRKRIDQEIDSMMIGVRGWKKQDANKVREILHKKHSEFWEDTEPQQNEVKYETKDHIEKTRKDFEYKMLNL